MAQWLTALTALAEDLNSVPGIQFSQLTVTREFQFPFLAPLGPSVHMQTHTHRRTQTQHVFLRCVFLALFGQ